MTFPLDPPIVIVGGARTPWAKFTGSLKEYTSTDLAVMCGTEAVKRSGVAVKRCRVGGADHLLDLFLGNAVGRLGRECQQDQ